MADTSVDELGTPPDYKAGISVQEMTKKLTGTGTFLITRTRPDGRVKP